MRTRGINHDSSGALSRLCIVVSFVLLSITFSISAFAQGRSTARSRTLIIQTEPNAIVWLDGVRYGKTNESGRFTIKSVSGSAHTLRVRADGFKEISRAVPTTHDGELSIALAQTSDPAELAFQEAERLATVDREKAAAAYKKALSLKPRYIEAHVGLARIYSDASDFENALKAVRDARRVLPALAELSAIEGRIHKDTGDEQKAIAAFKRAIAEGRGFQPEAYTGLGMLYKDRAETAGGSNEFEQEAADYREAARYFATAVKQLASSPDAPVVYQLLGLVYEKQKKYKEAIALYEEFLRLFPDTPEATAVQSFIVQLRKQMTEQP